MSANTRAIEVYVPYTATCVPKRCRNPRTETFSTRTTAVIRSPGPSDARIAFWLNSCRLNRPHIPATGRHEVVFYDSHHWWPLNPLNDVRNPHRQVSEHRPIEENFTADQLLVALRTEGADVLGLEHNHYWGKKIYRVAERPTTTREWWDDEDNMVALAARKVWDHLMIWNGRAYAKGGEPVYFQHCLGSPGTSDDCMASIGPDRSLEPTGSGLPMDIGRFAYAQTAFMYGWFQRADQYGLAKSRRSDASKRGSRVADYIDVLLPEAVTLRPQEVRLDALFRAAFRNLVGDKDPAMAELRTIFTNAENKYPRPSEVSRIRYHALMEFKDRLDYGRSFQSVRRQLRDIYESFSEFEATAEASGMDFSFSDADDSALGALGDRSI